MALKRNRLELLNRTQALNTLNTIFVCGKMEEKSEFEKWSKHIDNLPTECAFCRKKWNKDKIKYIKMLGRNYPLCNNKCARNFALKQRDIYLTLVDDYNKRTIELLEEGN